MRIKPLVVMILIVLALFTVVAPTQARADSGYFCREIASVLMKLGMAYEERRG